MFKIWSLYLFFSMSELLYACVDKAKEILLSLEYPCDGITPVQEELKPLLNHSSELFAIDFLAYLTNNLHVFDEHRLFVDGGFEKVRGLKPEDYRKYLEERVYYLEKSNLRGSKPHYNLLQLLS